MNETIVTDPNVMMGKPVVAGTRVTVEHILEELGSGRTIEELLQAHPRLTPQSVQAALTYAARVVREDSARPRRDVGS